LHNQIGFGRLQLNNRISKSELLEHRPEFIDDDITKLLIGSLPDIEDTPEITNAMYLYILGEDDGQIIRKSIEEMRWLKKTKVEEVEYFKALAKGSVEEEPLHLRCHFGRLAYKNRF